MIESSDYGLIADQLYLLPFVRRYSAFLGLDGEEIAMRFVREVQRAEGTPPARMSEPLVLANSKRTHWGRLVAAAAVLAAVIVLYFLAARRRAIFQPSQATIPASRAQSVAPPMAAALRAPDTSVVANPSGATAPAASRTEPPMRTTGETAAPRSASGASSVRGAGQPGAERR
jgi:cytoskeletal protein RodZ